MDAHRPHKLVGHSRGRVPEGKPTRLQLQEADAGAIAQSGALGKGGSDVIDDALPTRYEIGGQLVGDKSRRVAQTYARLSYRVHVVHSIDVTGREPLLP